MEEFQFDPQIADDIIVGRILRLPTLKDMAQRDGIILDEALWLTVEPKWRWHNALSTEDLKRKLQR